MTKAEVDEIIVLIGEAAKTVSEIDERIRQVVDVEDADARMNMRYELKSMGSRLEALIPALRELSRH